LIQLSVNDRIAGAFEVSVSAEAALAIWGAPRGAEKGDLAINCDNETWPDIEASCLPRMDGSGKFSDPVSDDRLRSGSCQDCVAEEAGTADCITLMWPRSSSVPDLLVAIAACLTTGLMCAGDLSLLRFW
jgi:hypothetical protein